MAFAKSDLKPIRTHVWEIPQSGAMKVPARFYANEKLLPHIFHDNALEQLVNVASLPGIQKYALAMPDIHWGYGFPIGGVAAMDSETGIISPGGVGYDINCGVRLISTQLAWKDVEQKQAQLINGIFAKVPTGVGSSGAIFNLTPTMFQDVCTRGAQWAIQQGFGEETDLQATEEFGRLAGALPDQVSDRTYKRGKSQMGTLGSGNHFIEIGVVERVFDEKLAEQWGLFPGAMTLMIHTGSRGFGHQICDEYVKLMLDHQHQLNFQLPDKQLACAYIQSDLGKRYFGAMACAANFAWANRQVIMHLSCHAILEALHISEQEAQFQLIYDVCHNIAKFETHLIDDSPRKVCVHRKGATRAFGPQAHDLADRFAASGQPVIIPGDMGTESYLCVGTQQAMTDTFGSSCHGAGRAMSRHKALRSSDAQKVLEDLKQKHIYARAYAQKTLVEEMSSAYKNVSDVVDTMHESGITHKVVKLRPVGVVKG